MPPIYAAVQSGQYGASKTLILLGAPVTVNSFTQIGPIHPVYSTAELRADLQDWCNSTLTQHRIFCDPFLMGCSAHAGISLAMLDGLEGVRAKIGAFGGVTVGAELRRVRVAGEALSTIDWNAHDETNVAVETEA